MIFPASSLIYVYSGFVSGLVAFLSFRIYKETKSEISHHFSVTALGVCLGELLWGLPIIIFGSGSAFVVFGYLIAWIPAMFGLIYSFLSALEYNLVSRKKINVLAGVLLLAIFIFVIGHFFNPPRPYLDENGLTHWNVLFYYSLFSFILIGILAIYPGFVFVYSKVSEKNAKIKQILFGLTFIFAAIGGSGAVLFSNNLIDNSLLIFISLVFQFIGFSLIAFLFVFYKKFK